MLHSCSNSHITQFILFKYTKLKLRTIDEQLKALEDKSEVSLQDAYEHFSPLETKKIIPNILRLLKLAVLCPIGNAVCVRLFSLLKLVKSSLRSSLGDPNLDMIMRINEEAPQGS